MGSCIAIAVVVVVVVVLLLPSLQSVPIEFIYNLSVLLILKGIKQLAFKESLTDTPYTKPIKVINWSCIGW